jgi:hypothetical protein
MVDLGQKSAFVFEAAQIEQQVIVGDAPNDRHR